MTGGGRMNVGWRRCWGGRVLHYYGTWSNYDTLCGKSLRGHGDDPRKAGPWPRCKRCLNSLRSKAVLEGQEEEESA